MSASAAADIVVVRLLRFPLDVYQRSTEQFEGLKREFTLLALGQSNDIPRRLVELVESLTAEYADTVSAADRAREEAIARGQREIAELLYEAPRAAAGGAIALSRMLDEADNFCREGDLLLSLATPEDMLAFRRWYLGEFVAQAAGLPPLAWPDADHAAIAATPILRGEDALAS